MEGGSTNWRGEQSRPKGSRPCREPSAQQEAQPSANSSEVAGGQRSAACTTASQAIYPRSQASNPERGPASRCRARHLERAATLGTDAPQGFPRTHAGRHCRLQVDAPTPCPNTSPTSKAARHRTQPEQRQPMGAVGRPTYAGAKSTEATNFPEAAPKPHNAADAGRERERETRRPPTRGAPESAPAEGRRRENRDERPQAEGQRSTRRGPAARTNGRMTGGRSGRQRPHRPQQRPTKDDGPNKAQFGGRWQRWALVNR